MMRRLHTIAGLGLGLLMMAIAGSGVLLSLEPVFNRASYPVVTAGTSVASLAAAVAARHDSVETLKLRDNGALTVAYNDGETSGIEVVDPATGAGLGPYVTSPFFRAVTDFHRALLADDNGRLAVGGAAGGMLLLSVSGLALMARRQGGLAGLLKPVRGSTAARWHGELGRLALVGLLLSSLTGLWMTASNFQLLPTGQSPSTSASAEGAPAAPIASLAALAATDVTALRELTFPASDDPTDVFTLVTNAGEAAIDPATGRVIDSAPANLIDRIDATMTMLHTGRGVPALALLLGLMSATVPALAVTGTLIWLRRRAARPALVTRRPSGPIDTVILVGSEGNSTWGFARTLAEGLEAQGQSVLTAAMNELSADHLKARRMLVLTATYGDGAAPASAHDFLARLATLDGSLPVAVLGFGDRTFPRFCAFAHQVSDALSAKNWPMLLDFKRIDRQSAQEFAQWGRDLGVALGMDLRLEHVAERPRTSALELIERESYGEAVGAPVAILRFRAPADARTGRAGTLPAFEAGDLVGILPPGGGMARLYSLASSREDGVLEICVRLMPGGLASTYLHSLTPGDRIEAFIRENPSFRPAEGKAPLILIGAGAGIGPLTGFVRANREGRPVHLYWGGRSPASDFLYEHELAQHLADKRLTSLRTAFSRVEEAAYVQDRLSADAHHLRDLIAHGAQILVCGGRDMALGVTHALEAVVRPLGLDLATLKSDGRYVEDVY